MSVARERIIDCLPPRKGSHEPESEPTVVPRNKVWLVALIVVVGFVLWWIVGRKSS